MTRDGKDVVKIELERTANESLIDYHKRLVYGKLVDKTLSDYDYAELSKYVYGKDYAPDVVRRMLYGSKFTLELLDRMREDGIEDPDLLTELRRKQIDLEKERQRFFDQRREYKKLVTSDGRWEYLTGLLADSADRLRQEMGALYDDAPVITEYGDADAILVFSDWHYGMKTSNVFNRYDTEICVKRVQAVVRNAIRRIMYNGVRNLHVVILGDIFHGAIHVSARVASEELVCDQLMQSAELLAQSIDELSRHVETTRVYMTYGNHGRTVANKHDNLHRDNLERLIPWWLEQRFKDREDISIEEDDGTEFQYINACGHWICATHGDLDTIRSAPLTVSALARKRYGRDIELVLLGDKHHRASDSDFGVDALLCGSLCGTDDYANEHRLYAPPSQLLLTITPEDGVDAEYRLKCE